MLRALTSTCYCNWYRVNVAVLIGLMAAVLSLSALARQGEPPKGWQKGVESPVTAPVLKLPAIDRKKLLTRDEALKHPAPRRFAEPIELSIKPTTHGQWQEIKGGRLWRVRIHVPGATDLNFGFTRYHLSPGATLHVYSESEDYYEGPYSNRDNKPHGQLWTPVVPGDRAVIELFVPDGGTAELELTQIGAGYRDFFGRLREDKPRRLGTRSGPCHIDVICLQGQSWDDQIRSVAKVTRRGIEECTGQLITDVPRSFRNFFVTAAHCIKNVADGATMVFYWNYESPACGERGGGSLSDNQTGATFLASKCDVDTALFELDIPPDPAFNVFYSGWDATGAVPQGSVGIHHPHGEEKAMSVNLLPLTTDHIGGRICKFHRNDTAWKFNWQFGVTEPGSSGGGLWDPATKRLVGVLNSGGSSCADRADHDLFGKFSSAWNGGTGPQNRLMDWLDPARSGKLEVDGTEAIPQITLKSYQSSDHCDSEAALDNGIWERGESIDIEIELQATGDFTGVHGTLSSLSPGVTILNGSSDWPDLNFGAPATNLGPFKIRLDRQYSMCFKALAFRLDVTSNEGGPFVIEFSEEVGESGALQNPTVPIEFPEDSTDPVTSTLEVTENKVLADVDVRVRIDYVNVGDLYVYLISPSGTQVMLLVTPGQGCSHEDMDVTFDDSATLDPEKHCENTRPWLTGRAVPFQPLADFNGESARGSWTLKVEEQFPSPWGVGTLIDWELITNPAVGGRCSVCPAPDLVVESISDPGDPIPVDGIVTIILFVDVKNTGKGSADPSIVSAHITSSDPGSSQTRLTRSTRLVPALMPGETSSIHFKLRFSITTPPPLYKVHITADANDDLIESNENNNTRTRIVYGY